MFFFKDLSVMFLFGVIGVIEGLWYFGLIQVLRVYVGLMLDLCKVCLRLSII